MAELQEHYQDQFMVFWDSAYKRRSHTTSYYAELDERLERWNRQMKMIRISIEWNYGTNAGLFDFIEKYLN